jgi:predicted esterase
VRRLFTWAPLVLLVAACTDDSVTSGLVTSTGGDGSDAGVIGYDDAGNPIGEDGGVIVRPDGGGGGNDGGTITGGPIPAGSSTRTYNVAGKSRSAIVFAPSALTGPAPLAILLHGNGDTSANFVAALGFQAKAAAQKFIFVAPQGIPQTFTYFGTTLNVDWDAYRRVSEGNIDLPLLDAIRADLGASSSVDPKKIFLFGYSQGGYLSFRYGMDASATLSCTAVCAAANPLGPTLLSGAARKIPVAMQIGTNDYGINAARTTRDQLQNAGFPLQYDEIQGAGHVPFPGDPGVPLGYCLGQALP